MSGGLVPFETALEQLLAMGRPLEEEMVPLDRAAGRRLARDLEARLTLPPADMSAMDGYALRFADLPGPLRLVGESAAGRAFAGRLAAGEAVRIFTGAPLPDGADTVAVQEDAVAAGGSVHFPGEGPRAAGAHVRLRGQQFGPGDRVARAGDLLTPARLGLLASAGHGRVPVHRHARVALLSTGDELVAPGVAPGPGQVVGGNAVMLAALLRQAGADVADLGIVADTRAALLDAIRRAQGADLLVTVGGASVGDHDLVRPVLEEAGAALGFWRVAMQPGKPLMAGRLGAGLVVGLPGNPVSAFVCARLFLVPLLRRMGGAPEPRDASATAPLGEAVPANGTRMQFLRATLREGCAVPAARQDSSLLTVLAEADLLVIRPPHAGPLPAGASVPVLFL